MSLVSIVIPIYNVGNKIQKIIKTLNKNLFLKDNFEIIFVDDGSKLNEEDIIKKYSNFNYSYYKKKNGGALSARIFGAKKANAKFIWFVDPDDDIYIDEILLSRINKLILNNNDVIFFNTEEIFSSKKNVIRLFPREKIKFKNYLFNLSFRSCSLCDKIIKKEIILNKSFDVNFNGYHEDTLLWFQILSKIKKISYINNELYKYYRFDSEDMLDSAMTQMKKNREMHEIFMLNALEKIFSYYANQKESIFKNKKFLLKVINHYIISDLFFTKKNFVDSYKEYKFKINLLIKKYNFMHKKMPLVWIIYYLNYLARKLF